MHRKHCFITTGFYLWAILRSILGPVHTKVEKYENGVFTLKMHQMFSVHTTPEKFENAATTGHFVFVTWSLWCHRFRKACFENFYRPHWKTNLALSNYSGLKSVFENRRLRHELVWTVNLHVEIKLRFQTAPAWCEHYFNFKFWKASLHLAADPANPTISGTFWRKGHTFHNMSFFYQSNNKIKWWNSELTLKSKFKC